MSLSLAFKTDKLTLDKRIELHQRARDITEQNIEQELEGLKEAMKVSPLLMFHLRQFYLSQFISPLIMI